MLLAIALAGNDSSSRAGEEVAKNTKSMDRI
jgi:hypothetical protein